MTSRTYLQIDSVELAFAYHVHQYDAMSVRRRRLLLLLLLLRHVAQRDYVHRAIHRCVHVKLCVSQSLYLRSAWTLFIPASALLLPQTAAWFACPDLLGLLHNTEPDFVVLVSECAALGAYAGVLLLRLRVRVGVVRRLRCIGVAPCDHIITHAQGGACETHDVAPSEAVCEVLAAHGRYACPRTLASCVGPDSVFAVSALRMARNSIPPLVSVCVMLCVYVAVCVVHVACVYR
jgi:hypothetical protein